MTSVELRRSGRKSAGHRKHSDGGYSDTSSVGSYLDETDREVSSLTDRAFRSLCIGDEAVYNDSDLCSSSPCSQRDRQLAFCQRGQEGRDADDNDGEGLDRTVHESFRLKVQQYGQDQIHGRLCEADIQRDPQWEINGERGQGRVSATFRRSFVETSQQEEYLGEEQASFHSNGATESSTRQRRSRSRVSSLIRAFNSEGHRDGAGMDGKLREWNDETSWDKSALMSMRRELSEFSTSYQQNSGNFPSAGPFSSHHNNFHSAAHVNSASFFISSSHSRKSMFEQHGQSNFFIHSEFSPFKLWRDHSRFPFQQAAASGFMHCSEFPKWYETPMYRELSLDAQPQGPHRFDERGIRQPRNTMAPAAPPTLARPTSTSTLLQKASAVEKRCESELTGHYPHKTWMQSPGTKRFPSQRPSTASPTSEMSRRVQDTISSVKALQQKIKMMTEQNTAATATANEQGGLCSNTHLNPFGNNAANAVGGNTSTTPFSISHLLSPSVHAHHEAEATEVRRPAVSPQPVEHPPVRAESRGATPDVRGSSYKSRATGLLFNLKDNRKRVKSTYSPATFKGSETLEKNKHYSTQEARDTVIDIPDFHDPDPQLFRGEESSVQRSTSIKPLDASTPHEDPVGRGFNIQGEQQRVAKQFEERNTSRPEEEKRAEDMRVKRLLEENRASLAQEERRAAQREEEKRAREREAIAMKIKQRREKQREAERRAREKQAALKEEEMRTKQREEERQMREIEEKRLIMIEKERRQKLREEEERRKEDEERRWKQREDDMAAQEEQQRRADQEEQERRADQEEQQRRADQEEQQRRADQEEQQRREAEEEQKRRADQEEQQRREAEEEQKRRADQEEQQRRTEKEEQQRRADLIEAQRQAKHIEELILAEIEEKNKIKQREERERIRKQEQEIEEQRHTNEELMRSQREEDQRIRNMIKQRQDLQIEEERNRRLEENQEALKEEKRVAQEWMQAQREDESRANNRGGEEEEKLANHREKERDTRMEEQKRAAQRMDALQYYAITSKHTDRKPMEREQRSPPPSPQRHNMSGLASSENSGSHARSYRPHAAASPAPSVPRSNTSSPSPGAKPLMFRVKDNTIRGSSLTKSVKPRFHKNFGDDFRVGSPMERASGREEDEQDSLRRSAGTPVYPDAGLNRLDADGESSTLQPAPSSQDYSAPLQQRRPYSRRSIVLDEDDSRSVISNVSEGGESFATSAADLADIRGLHDYERPESACSFGSAASRSLGRPPTVPPKSEKALRRAQRLTTRRIRKELSKIDGHAGVEKSLQEVSSVPSSSGEERSAGRQVVASPHFASPISLAHAPTSGSSFPSALTERPSSHSSFYATPGPISLPVASPHAAASLPGASSKATGTASHSAPPETMAHVPPSPALYPAQHQAPVAQYHVESSYPHSYPLTQRKVLQDLGSGQYFVVDVPVTVKTKTFFDPETGKYVQLNVRQSGQNYVRPQTHPQQQLQPQMHVKLQHQAPDPSASKPAVLHQGHRDYPRDRQPPTGTSVPCHSSSAPSAFCQEQRNAGESHAHGQPAHQMGQKCEGHRYSPEKTPYMDTANDKEKTFYNLHGPNEWCPEDDANSQHAGGSVGEDDNSAPSQCEPRDIITISELEDFMEMSDW
ncbi:uncharacterized protein ACO6RY_16966 [Pungitius sinensis]